MAYNLREDYAEGDPDPADDLNTTNAAVNDLDVNRIPALMPKSLIDAKGDLIVGTAADTAARLPAGTTGQVLTADPGETSGLKWAAAGGGSVLLSPVPKSGTWISPVFNTNHNSNDARASGSGVGCQIPLSAPISIDRIGCYVSTAEAVNAKVLLYNSDGDGYPYQLVASGVLDCTSSGRKEITISTVALPSGLYHGFIRSNSGSSVRFVTMTTRTPVALFSGSPGIGTAGLGMSADVGSYASPTTTLTAWSTGAHLSDVPWIFMRRA